jgi:hypothetical protein
MEVLLQGRCMFDTCVYHLCPVIDLTPASREVPRWHSDTRPKVLYYREAILGAPDVRIVPCHLLF